MLNDGNLSVQLVGNSLVFDDVSNSEWLVGSGYHFGVAVVAKFYQQKDTKNGYPSSN